MAGLILLCAGCGLPFVKTGIPDGELPPVNAEIAEAVLLQAYGGLGLPPGRRNGAALQRRGEAVPLRELVELTAPVYLSGLDYRIVRERNAGNAPAAEIRIDADSLAVELKTVRSFGIGRRIERTAGAVVSVSFDRADGTRRVYRGRGQQQRFISPVLPRCGGAG